MNDSTIHGLLYQDNDESNNVSRTPEWISIEFRFPIFIGVILLAVLFGLDVTTTNVVLLSGGYEQNSVMALIVQYPALHLMIKGIVIIAITLITQDRDCMTKGKGLIILVPVLLLYSLVIYNNATVMRQLVGI